MMKKEFILQHIDELYKAANDILQLMLEGEGKLAFLYGDLGAGKTTLVKEIAKQLGTKDETSSPTYSLVNEYKTEKGNLYHIDLYRINDTHEAIDMGIEEYIDGEYFCFVEWPQVIELLPDSYWKIELEAIENEVRLLKINFHINSELKS